MKQHKKKPDDLDQLRKKAGDNPDVNSNRPSHIKAAPLLDDTSTQKLFEQSAEWFQILVNATFEGIAITENGRFINANQQLTKMLGYEHQELIGMSVADLIPAEDRRRVLENITAGRESITEHKAIRKDGSMCVIEAHGKTITYQNRPVRITAIRDITDRRNAEDAMRQSEQRFRALAAATFEGIIFVENNIVLEANEQFALMFGYELGEVIGLSIMEFLVPEERARVRQIIESDTDCTGEYRCLRKNGSTFFVEAHGRTIERDGRRVRIKTLRDITDRKRAEDASRRSENMLRATIESTADGILVIDENGRIAHANNQFITMWRIPQELLACGDDDKLLAYVLDQLIEPEAFLAKVHALYKSPKKDFDTLKFKDGRLFERFSSPLLCGNEVCGRVWSFRDITERRKAEDAIRESQTLLRAICEGSPDPVFVKDCQSHILMANPATLYAMGKPADKVLGRTDAEIYDDPAIARAVMENDRRIIETSKPEVFEETIRTPEGPRIFLSTKSPMRDADGNVVGIIGIARDITDRKRMEDAMAFIARRRWSTNGEENFFASLVRYLAKTSGMDYAFIGRLKEDRQSVQTIAICADGNIAPNIEYQLENSPCQNVVGQSLCCYPEGIQRLFPHDDLLKEMQAESYIGTPLWDSKNQPIGLIAAIHRQALTNPQPAESLLQLVAVRAAGELERRQAEQRIEDALAAAERQTNELNAMFNTLAETAILYDASGKAIKVNAAAITTFGFDPTGLSADEYNNAIKKLNVHYPDGREVISSQLPSRRALRGETVRNEELSFTNAVGKQVTVENSVLPLVSDDKIIGAVATWHDITDRKKVEVALRESEQQFRSLVETTSDWVWEVDSNCIYTYASPKVRDLLGYEPQEIIGKTPFNLMPPDEAKKVKSFYEDIRSSLKPIVELENINLHKNGRLVILETNGVPVLDDAGNFMGYRGIDRDITDRKEAEKALLESEWRFRLLVEAMPGIVWTAEPDGTVDFYNQRWYEYSGLPHDADEAAWQQIFHPDDLQATIEVWTTAIRDEKPYNIEHRLKGSDGQYRWHLSRGLPLRDSAGQIIKWFGMAIDIDDQKQTLEELAHLKDELEDKNDELASIISVASHDLRSPLVNIKGFAGELAKDTDSLKEMLAGIALPEQVHKNIETIFSKNIPEAIGFIENSAGTMNQMLVGLMQVAKAGIAPLKLQRVDMNLLFEKIAANFQFKLKETDLQLLIEPLLPCRADVDQITQVFSNLIDNAIKYRDPQKQGQIRIYASTERSKVTYCVEDNGKGIDPEFHSKIFALFCRLSPDAAKGEGLGLTIAKRMIERQGGHIWVDSELGKGSKFFVSLPS